MATTAKDESASFVECQCACGEFWRFEPGKEPDDLPACPECRPDILKIDGVTFVGGERGPAMAYVKCAGCGHPWATFTSELRDRPDETIVHCSRCNGDGRGGLVQWGHIPKETTKMAKSKSNGDSGDGRVEIDRFEERLLCTIEDDDIAKKANDLALKIEEREQVRLRRRAAVASFKDKLTHLDESITELGESVRTKAERRNVTCIEYLIERQNRVILVRTDTGAVESERPATPEDRQQDMFNGGKGGKGKRAKKDKGADEAAAPAE